MRVVWNRGQLMVQMNIDTAKSLLTWLQKIGTMVPDSVQERLRSRLTVSYPSWSKNTPSGRPDLDDAVRKAIKSSLEVLDTTTSIHNTWHYWKGRIDGLKEVLEWMTSAASTLDVVRIPFRGSVTDLATDVAFELKPEQGRELIDELERFIRVEPSKFKHD